VKVPGQLTERPQLAQPPGGQFGERSRERHGLLARQPSARLDIALYPGE